MIAARVADQLRSDTGIQVELVKGGFGELSAYIDDRKVIDTNRLWYPTPGKVVKKIKALLAEG
jgi:hypothetical protein